MTIRFSQLKHAAVQEPFVIRDEQMKATHYFTISPELQERLRNRDDEVSVLFGQTAERIRNDQLNDLPPGFTAWRALR